MTLTGHTSGIRCCRYSSKGDLIVSAAEDASLRIWDAYTGAELVTVTGLPGPTYPGLADPYHGERVVTFDLEDQLVLAGSEDGGVQILDRNGAMRRSCREHAAAVTGLAFTPDNQSFVTCSKDQTVKVWNAAEGSVKTTIGIPGAALGLGFSPAGDRLAVSMTGGGGLAIIDVKTWSVTASGGGLCSLNLCLAWSPSGHQIITGGDNSAVTVWDAASAAVTGQWTGHRAWIWSLKYTPDGSRVLTCSSDRTMRVWDVSTGTMLVTLGGHLHRLCWVDIRPEADQFVTCSLDHNLKVWDTAAVLSGKVPPVGQLHYIVLTVTPDDNIITCQGWSTCCNVFKEGGGSLGTSANHNGFMYQTAITRHSTLLVTLDTGHKGAYESGAARNACVMVTDLVSLDSRTLSAGGSTAIGANDQYIAIGTLEGMLHVVVSETLEEKVAFSWCGQETQDGAISGITPIALSQRGHLAAACKVHIKIWDISPGEPNLLTEMTPPTPGDEQGHVVTCLTYSPDGAHFAWGTVGGSVSIHQSSDYALLQRLPGHTGLIKDLRFSHDGQWLATVGGEGSLRVWSTGHPGYQLRSVYYAPINCIGWLQNQTIVTGEATGNKGYLVLC